MEPQCPYIHDSWEPDHTYNCTLRDGHDGPHADYMGDESGRWYVPALMVCPLCRGQFRSHMVGYALVPGRPEVRQRRREK